MRDVYGKEADQGGSYRTWKSNIAERRKERRSIEGALFSHGATAYGRKGLLAGEAKARKGLEGDEYGRVVF